jgi:ASCH domain
MTHPAVKALTIRQPWAWAVVYAGKDVENRRWQTSYRGPLLIHAAKEDDPAGSAMVLWTMADPGAFGRPGAAFKARGAIIGMAYLADIFTDSASRRAQPHRFHWTLEFPAPVDPPVPCSGMPGLWTPPPAAAEAVAHWL